MPPIPPEDPVPLFVRLPRGEAARLHRAAFERGVSKRELVTMLVRRHLGDPPWETEAPAPFPGPDVVVGRHDFAPADVPEVLTVEQAAALLQVSVEAIVELADKGELPGRRIAGEWRFSRAALVAGAGLPEVVVVDPPRAGLAVKALRRTGELQAERIVYVSCNPATLARDTVELVKQGYRLKRAGILDMFPQTAHVEAMALFEAS